MSADTDALRDYVHFLRESEGVRSVKLSLAARQGLAKLAGNRDRETRPSDESSSLGSFSEGSGRTPGGGPSSGGPGYSLPGSSRPGGTTGSDVVTASGMTLSGPPISKSITTPPAVQRAATAEPVPPLKITGSSKADQLAHLAERAAACVKCPHLVARRTNVVFGVGDPNARLMFIGEAPGEEEDRQGEPFVGRAGQLLTKMIIAMGLTREQVYIANIVKCRPDMPPGAPGNRKPTKQEMDTCVPYLRAQVEVIKPGAIVALGATSVEGLLGPIGSIGQLRGNFYEYRGIPLMPTYHPSYLLRNASNTEKRKVWDDLLKVMEKLAMPISEKQRGYFLAK